MSMKNGLYLVIITFLLVACGQSKEKKAEALIKKDLRTILHKPETYRAIETNVDSAFSPYDNPELFKELEKLGKLQAQHLGLEIQVGMAQNTMGLWGGVNSTFGRNRYKGAKKQLDSASDELDKIEEKYINQLNKVTKLLLSDREFIGYKVTHNYRADDNAGKVFIGNTIFYFDREFREIIYSIDLEEYKAKQEIIANILEKIEEAE